MEEINTLKCKEIIKKIYEGSEEEVDNIIKNVNQRIKDELKTINYEDIVGSSENPKELKEVFKDIEDNYNIKITRYNEELYKLGFIDGVNLAISCLKN